MEKVYRGSLIVFEGIDGSGKSTLAQALFKKLSADHEVILTRQPGGTELGKTIRQAVHNHTIAHSPIAEYLLFAADRAQHIHELIIPALKRGAIVLCDRFADSSIAYQGYGRNGNIDYIKTINAWILQGVKPALTFYCALDYATANKRIVERNKKLTSFEQEAEDYFKRVINGFESLYKDRHDVIQLNANLAPDNLAQEAYSHCLKIISAQEKQ